MFNSLYLPSENYQQFLCENGSNIKTTLFLVHDTQEVAQTVMLDLAI